MVRLLIQKSQLQSRHNYTKMARLVKCLPYKYRDLNLMPQKPCGNSQAQADAGKPNTKEAEPRGAVGSQPTLTANGKRKKKRWTVTEKRGYLQTYTHTRTHTCTRNTIPLTII